MTALIHTGSATDPARIGGKAANLALLAEAGLEVPPWFAIDTEALDQTLRQGGLAERVAGMLRGIDAGDRAALRATSEQLRGLIMGATLPDAVAQAIRQAYADHFPGQPPVAVRSSGVGEDSAAASFAGQFDSFLYVTDAEALLEAVRGCWASAYSERVLTYRAAQGVDQGPPAVGVVVQAMVDAERSGVLFTAHPTTGDRQQLVVSAVWGLGEGLVSGALAADSYVLSRDGAVLEQQIASKERRTVRGQTGGTRTEPLPDDLRDAPVLDEALCGRLARLGGRIEALYQGAPQDVEWSLVDGAIAVLQSRPITSLPALPSGKLRLWDNSNIIESYSGVTTPLTFSFARTAYREVYRQFLKLLGVPQRTIDDDDRTLRNMLGLIRGRIYYNLNNWYKLVSYLPGFELNRKFMEQMMGVRESATLDTGERAHDASGLARVAAWARVARVGVRLAWHFWWLERAIARFTRHFESVYEAQCKQDVDHLDCDQLLALYTDLENKLLRSWQAPIVNDFSAMIFFGLLRVLCGRWIPDAKPTLPNELLCGDGQIDSTEPTRALLEMATLVRADPALRQLIDQTPAGELHGALEARREQFPELWRRVTDYLDRYGDRCMMELKLESRNLRDDSSFMYQMLDNYATQELKAEQFDRQQQTLRAEAEETARRGLGWRPLRRLLFGSVLRRARNSVRNRENMRFARTKIFGMARRVFRALGRRYTELGLLTDPEEIFYLELPEVFGLLDGTLSSDELGPLARMRQARFEQYRSEPAPPDRFATRGPVYLSRLETTRAPIGDDPDRLQGIGVCPGEVTAACRVIHSPTDEMNLDGEILVARHTDPGWVPLFLSASGLLVERGSLLSHSAIVARELGLPAIIAIPDLTERIADRRPATMNGETGIVALHATDESRSS